jgi:hypothetical protein
MGIPKVRNYGKYGIVTDIDAYDLPPQAFSFGVNARFRNNRITRAPVFRTARALTLTAPRYVLGSNPTSGLDNLYIGTLSGRLFKTTPSAETDYSVTGYVDSDAEGQWSHVHLADVLYVNREDRVPWSLRTVDSEFQELDNWDATWRAKLLRTCSGALVALNVTKGSTNYPTMVKTSSFPTSGAVPTSWDETSPSTNAYENIIAEMEGPIVDAQSLGEALIIYGRRQAFVMQFVGGADLFAIDPLPFAQGAINANCAVEINGQHYVFGVDDIYTHDGVSKTSICEGQTRDFIFRAINLTKSDKCFVYHNRALKELHFCYVSGDRGIGFDTVDACNRSAVYDLVSKTWTFDDLPAVYAAARAALDSSLTYDAATQTYESIGGSYQDLDDSFKKATVFVGDTDATLGLTAELYAHDLYGAGSTVPFEVNTTATKGLYLEREGIDFDEMDEDLRGYKVIHSIYPQARVDEDAEPLEFSWGACDFIDDDVVWSDYDSYGGTNYKLDFETAGRFIALRIRFDDYKSMTLLGFDLEYGQTAQV